MDHLLAVVNDAIDPPLDDKSESNIKKPEDNKKDKLDASAQHESDEPISPNEVKLEKPEKPDQKPNDSDEPVSPQKPKDNKNGKVEIHIGIAEPVKVGFEKPAPPESPKSSQKEPADESLADSNASPNKLNEAVQNPDGESPADASGSAEPAKSPDEVKQAAEAAAATEAAAAETKRKEADVLRMAHERKHREALRQFEKIPSDCDTQWYSFGVMKGDLPLSSGGVSLFDSMHKTGANGWDIHLSQIIIVKKETTGVEERIKFFKGLSEKKANHVIGLREDGSHADLSPVTVRCFSLFFFLLTFSLFSSLSFSLPSLLFSLGIIKKTSSLFLSVV